MTNTLEQLSRCSVAVDLGSSRTRVYIKQVGLVVDEPSAVAVDSFSGALIAVGTSAERMAGRTPRHIEVKRPICNGTVVDIDMAQRMLRALVGTAGRRTWRRRGPMVRAAVTIPQGADPLARRAALETLTGVGARKVELVDAPTAAGVGCGLPVEQPEATMVLLCGASTTQVAVLSLGSVVSAATVPMGGDTVHNAVVQHLRYQHELILPGHAVNALHLAMTGEADRTGKGSDGASAPTSPSASVTASASASASAPASVSASVSGNGDGGDPANAPEAALGHDETLESLDPEFGGSLGAGLEPALGPEGATRITGPTELWGRDVATGMARTVTIDPEDVRAAVQAPLTGLSDTIRAVLHECPPDLVADLAVRGMVLTGGSAMLPGLAERLRTGTGMAVHIAEEPSLSAVNGLAAMLEGRVTPVGEPQTR